MSSHTEQTEYSVIRTEKEYEVRRYPAHIVAQTVVQGQYQQALNRGFRIVAGYIFGGNVKNESIPMTAPVIAQKTRSEQIAMTAPVTTSINGESHIIAFGMPRSYTLATLPKPTDSRVQIVTIPEQKMAVIQFSWLRTNNRIEQKTQELFKLLKRDRISVRGAPQYAGYNAPWTPPWMTRHEILVEIQ